MNAALPYSVLFWGSHPGAENDDCWTGEHFATKEEALIAFRADFDGIPNCPTCDVAFIEIDGPDINEMRANPAFAKRRRERDDEWQREIATQAGMAFGCDGYNDAMGY